MKNRPFAEMKRQFAHSFDRAAPDSSVPVIQRKEGGWIDLRLCQ